jgi:hypothetical protein
MGTRMMAAARVLLIFIDLLFTACLSSIAIIDRDEHGS